MFLWKKKLIELYNLVFQACIFPQQQSQMEKKPLLPALGKGLTWLPAENLSGG